MTEEWRAIPGWERRYQISNRFRVQNCITGRILKTSGNRVHLYDHGERVRVYIHEIVANVFPDQNLLIKLPRGKLSTRESREIRLRVAKGEDYRKMPGQYGVQLKAIKRLLFGKTWHETRTYEEVMDDFVQ